MVKVTYDSGSDPVLRTGERVFKSVEVWTNDPKKRMVLLSLQGVVVAAGIPRIVFPETTFDFGSVREGEKIRHRFYFRNNGTDVLRIGGVVPS
ncbi:MAG TPA: DUF1573 domain-containing protein [Nitrospirae bacterium]|nr:DUF1573 domain-containing protein [Nitrospirota bacterium]